MQTRRASAMMVLAGTATVIAGFFAGSIARVQAYSFDWIGTPYLSDDTGIYAYQDFNFQWWGCSSDWCWTGNAALYVNFASQQSGWEYNSWMIAFHPPNQSAWQWAYRGDGGTLNYWNTPYTFSVSGGIADIYGDIVAETSICKSSVCAAPVGAWYGARMVAYVVSGASTASCVLKENPAISGC